MAVDLDAPLRRLLPDPAETTVDEQLAAFDPVAMCESPDRPYVFTNFAVTVDGHATIEGRSGAIGTDTDTAMLVGLRMRAEAIMIGAGTMRAERYGRLFTDPARRAVRERRGLPADPLFVLVSGRLDLPWDAPLFTDGGRLEHSFGPGRGGYLYVIDGRLRLNGDTLKTGDAAKMTGEAELELSTEVGAELILIDVPLEFERVGVWAGEW
jgi:hypothetical protein